GGSYTPVIVDVNDVYNEFGYGYMYHPQGVKNFLRFAVQHTAWTNKPEFLFIIGKGIDYTEYQKYTVAPITSYPFPVVPSFGNPPSDHLLSDFTFESKPQIATGRLTVWQGSEINTYLQKIKYHEASVADTDHQVSDSVLWRKNVLHIAGTSNAEQQAPILAALQKQEHKIDSIYLGADVTTIRKSSTTSVETVNSALIDSLFKSGLNLVQFFGHGSTSTLDYNLDNPDLLPNHDRFPVFLANGCSVGNSFVLAVGQKTLGEKFVLAPHGGSIAFIASVNTGLSNVLSTYTDSLYSQFATVSYGDKIGRQLKSNIYSMNLAGDASLRQHAEQILLNGDPATTMYSFSKPDFAVEEKGVSFGQLNITTALDSFDVQVVIHNLGKYTGDSVSIFIRRILPNGIENVLLHQNYSIAVSDTILLRVPVQGNLALGDNAIEILIDQEGFIDEVSELNNTYKRVFNIYNDDLVPVYPYEFGIVNVQGVTLKASTLNPFASLKTYVLQIDTTEQFNSPLLSTTKITSTGGVIKWQIPFALQDNTVYYWRTAMDTLYGNHQHRWSYSSFIYLDGSLPGWNQSHYYQWTKDQYNDIVLDSASRQFNFIGINKKLLVQNVCLRSPAPYFYDWPDYRVKMNGSTLYTDGCDPYPGYSSLQFMVIDTLTGIPWQNAVVGSAGRFGSFKPCRVGDYPNYIDPFFEFSFLTAASRKTIMDFIDSIPDGYYVMVQPRLCTGSCGAINKNFIKDWKADTTSLGAGVSLYHKLYNLGCTAIDSFYKNRPMIFFMKKNQPATVQQYVEKDSTKVLLAEFDYTTHLYEGSIATHQIGPAKAWGQLKRLGASMDPGAGDSVKVIVSGITIDGTETDLATVFGDTSLSFINAAQYPFLRLKMINRDNSYTTPEQLKYWRVLYELVPEVALNPNRHFSFTDTVKQGQLSRIEVAVENLTELPFDSMLVKYDVIDQNKTRKEIALKRYAPIPVYDTVIATLDFPSAAFSGNHLLALEVNPANDHPEQFHPNNLGYLNYYVIPDKQNPLLDVTFDGVHIMDKDIVSAKPFISISLFDDNKYLALDDTSLVKVYMRYPGDNPATENYIPFDGSVLKFIPADLSDGKLKNTARIEFRPEFTVDGDEYVLIVRAFDKSGNASGPNAYKVGFEVINKPSVTSVLNYPNPFTTSTQFVFTLTGAQIPSQFKIQILSPTGKVVREITRAELGDLHIGTNITPFKWKGDDQFGQPLANGVYLYRVVTRLNGEKMDHRYSGADRWMEHGFGKLYIMR
ncbi:MAG TPA: C25 family cysteine peptidase, partial [Chitinophagaceae bacterium]|nr:C25 family cysteine peptidase [Chitinophagaceae bacterium]